MPAQPRHVSTTGLRRKRPRHGRAFWLYAAAATAPVAGRCRRTPARRGLWLETFREGDWPAHRRHHARIVEAARAVQDKIATVMRDGATQLVRHFLVPTAAQGDTR